MIVLIVLLLLILPATVSGQNPTGPRVDIVPSGTSSGQTGELRFYELLANGVNYAGFKSPDALAGNLIWVLPTVDGTSGQALITDGAGNLSWGSGGGGGSGCVPGGGAGEVLFSSGAGACDDDPTLFWDNTGKDLRISGSSVVAELHVTTDFNAFGSNARVMNTAYSGSSVSFGGMYLGRTARGTAASPAAAVAGDIMLNNQAYGHNGSGFAFGGGYNFYAGSTWSGSNQHTVMSFTATASGSTTPTAMMWLGRETVGSLSLLNNHGIWLDDSGATARRLLWYDGSNTVHIGTADVTSPAGNIVMQAGDIGVVLERATTNTGTFGPRDGADIIALGSASRPFNSGRVLGGFTLGVTATSVPGTLVFTAISGTTLTMSKANTGSNHSWVLPGANAAGVLTNDGAGNLSWAAGGGGSFTCTTANNCVDISGTQTITGQKTLANHLLFNLNNVYSIGQTPGNWPNAIFGETIRGRQIEMASSISQTQFWRITSPSVSSFAIWSGSGGQVELQGTVFSVTDTQWSMRGYLIPASTAGNNGRIGTVGQPWRELWLSSFANITGGIITGSSSNSTLYVGASGNFYNRTLGGASTAVTCAGIANGWAAIATDNYYVVCRGGARYRAQLVAF